MGHSLLRDQVNGVVVSHFSIIIRISVTDFCSLIRIKINYELQNGTGVLSGNDMVGRSGTQVREPANRIEQHRFCVCADWTL